MMWRALAYFYIMQEHIVCQKIKKSPIYLEIRKIKFNFAAANKSTDNKNKFNI